MYLGVLCTLGNVCVGFGNNSFKHIARKQKKALDVPCYTPVLAWTSCIIGYLLLFFVLSIMPQTVFVCLGTVQLITTNFFNWWQYSQRLHSEQVLGIVFIFTGYILLCYDQELEKSANIHNTSQAVHLYSNPTYKNYLTFICTAYLLLGFYKNFLTDYLGSHPNLDTVIFSAQSAMLGTQSIVFTKTISGILMLCVANQSLYQVPFDLVFLLVTCLFSCISNVFWFYRSHIGVETHGEELIKPVNEILWVVFGVLSGGIYFEEFSFVHHNDTVFYSVCFIVYGVYELYQSTAFSLILEHEASEERERAKLLTTSSDSESVHADVQESEEVTEKGVDIISVSESSDTE